MSVHAARKKITYSAAPETADAPWWGQQSFEHQSRGSHRFAHSLFLNGADSTGCASFVPFTKPSLRPISAHARWSERPAASDAWTRSRTASGARRGACCASPPASLRRAAITHTLDPLPLACSHGTLALGRPASFRDCHTSVGHQVSLCLVALTIRACRRRSR